jgi:succinate dehydrogenase/fumarate reductase cytochrome b subunit
MDTPNATISTPRLARIQAQSGIVIALFLALHLLTTLMAVRGPAGYDGTQRIVRYVYQNPITEPLLLAAIVVHIGAGIARLRRRTKTENVTPRIRLHRYSAYFLTLAIVGHVAATRLPDVLFDIHVGFAALSYTLGRFPAIFFPYYVTLALAGLYHGAHGVYVALGTLGVRVPVSLRKGPGFNVPYAIIGAGLVLGLLAIGGVLFTIHDPRDNDFARLGESLLGD